MILRVVSAAFVASLLVHGCWQMNLEAGAKDRFLDFGW
jgi:hypothetical protein